MDEYLRYWQRRAEMGDVEAASRVLTIRIRSEDLNPQWVLIASYLEDPASMVVYPNVSLKDIRPSLRDTGGHAQIAYYEERLLPHSTPQNPIVIAAEDRNPRVNNALSSIFLGIDFLIQICSDFIEHHIDIWKQAYPDSDLLQRALVITSLQHRASIDEMRLLTGYLSLTEDPYNPAAMDLAECAHNLAFIARIRQEILELAREEEISQHEAFVGTCLSSLELTQRVQNIAFMSLFSLEDVEWQRQQLIDRLLA